MKLKTKTISIFLAILIIFSFPANAFAATKTSNSPFISGTYTHHSTVSSSEFIDAIDISYHNGSVDFSKLKKGGCDAVILRVGYRGYLAAGKLVKDDNFSTYYKNAKAAGLPIGVYFYSQALNTTEAKEEAEFVLKYIKDLDIQLPVFFDYEFAETSRGRLDSAWANKTINKQKMTDNAIAFCKAIENAGYVAGVYANKSFLSTNVDHTQFENDYVTWLAHYSTKTNYTGKFQIWQYSSKGKVSGTDSTYVDCNFLYSDNLSVFSKHFEVADISNKAYTGSQVKPELTVKANDVALVKGEDYYVTFGDNTDIGYGTVTITGINDFADFPTVKKEFKIVPTKVENLKFESRTNSTLTVSWDKNDTADKYKVQVHKSSGWVTAGTTDSTTLTVKDLAQASNYRIRVAAIKTVKSENFQGTYSSEIETATNPSKVTGLSSSAVKYDSLKLNWKKQTNASYYKVYMLNYDTNSYEFFKQVDGGKNNSLTIDNLKPNTKYRFKVEAFKNSKDGALLKGGWSDGKTLYTSPLTPKIKSAKASGRKKILTSWKKVSSVSGYEIMWSTTKDFSSNKKSVTASSGTASYKISTAQSNKTYYVRVRAFKTRDSKKTYSAWSKTLKVKTK